MIFNYDFLKTFWKWYQNKAYSNYLSRSLTKAITDLRMWEKKSALIPSKLLVIISLEYSKKFSIDYFSHNIIGSLTL